MDLHNMRMLRASNGAGLALERFLGLGLHLYLQDFDGCRSFQVEMFAQIDRSKAALPKQTEQAIVAHLLSHILSHQLALFSLPGRGVSGRSSRQRCRMRLRGDALCLRAPATFSG